MLARVLMLLGLLAVVAAVLMFFGLRDDWSAVPAVPLEGGAGDDAGAIEGGGSGTVERVPFQRPEPVPEKKAPGNGDALVMFGRVVHESRDAAVGSQVSIHRLGLDQAATGVVGDDGRFEFPVGTRRIRAGGESFLVLARHAPSGEMVVRHHTFYEATTSGRLDLFEFVLEQPTTLTIRVQEQDVAVPAARVRCFSSVFQVLEGTTDEQGEQRFTLPRGSYVLAASDAQGRRAMAGREAPFGSDPLVLELQPCHEVSVTVVDGTSRAPVAGARVSAFMQVPGVYRAALPDATIAPTDEAGRTTVAGVPPGCKLFVGARADGYIVRAPRSEAPGNGAEEVPPDTPAAEIALQPLRRLSWPVVDGELPAPPDGTVIRFRSETHQRWAPKRTWPQGIMESGRLVVGGVGTLYFRALAVTPEGGLAQARMDRGKSEGSTIAFRRPRSIRVEVTDPAGGPVVGEALEARDQGNRELRPQVLTDDQGIGRIEGLYGRTAEVYLGPPGLSGRMRLGTVNLDEGDGNLKVTVGYRRSVVLAITIDGKPGLPKKDFWIHVQNGQSGKLEKDPVRGEVRFSLRIQDPSREASLSLRSKEFPVESVTVPAEAGPWRKTLALQTAGTIIARVMRPPTGRAAIVLDEWYPKSKTWGGVISGPVGMRTPPAVNGEHRFPGLGPARYRVRDRRTGLCSAAVDITAPAVTRRVTLDLSRSGVTKGRVIVPEGYARSDARVHFEATGMVDAPYLRKDPRRRGVRISADGSFSLTIPGDRPVTLRTWHPLLMPSPARGSVTLREPRDDLVLELVSAAVLRLTAKGMSSSRSWLEDHPPRLRLSAPDRKPTIHLGLHEGENLRFGGFRPGTYDLWLDIMEFAPFIRRSVVIGEGSTDLGTIALSRGSRVRIAIKTRAGDSPPRISAFAWRIGEPAYTRGLNSRGEAEPFLTGLGAGRFRLIVRRIMGSDRRPFERVITVDGTNEIRVPFDAR